LFAIKGLKITHTE